MSDTITFTRQFNIATYKIKGMTGDTGIEFTKFMKNQLYLCSLTKIRTEDLQWKYYTKELECRLGEETKFYSWEDRSTEFVQHLKYMLNEYRRSEKEKVLVEAAKLAQEEGLVEEAGIITSLYEELSKEHKIILKQMLKSIGSLKNEWLHEI